MIAAVTLWCMAGILSASNASYRQVPEIALEFDGARAYIGTEVKAGDLGIDGNAAKSIEAWVYTRDFHRHGVFSLGATDSAGAYWGLRTRDGTDQWRVQSSGSNFDIDFTYPSLNRWVHFALVYTGSHAIVYADGNEVARAARKLNTSRDGALQMGRCQSSSFDGKIAEVRIWNRALDPAQIKARMNLPLGGEEEGLVGYWPLNEGAGNTARDLAGGKDGRLRGNPTWVLARPFVTDLTADREFRPGTRVVFGPVELRAPRGEPTYQWYLDGRAIPGATESSLVIPRASEDDVGTYYVKVDDAHDLTPVVSRRVRLAQPDWPMWRYDAARSAATPHQLAENLHLQWMRELPQPKRAWRHQRDHAGKLDFDVSYCPVVEGGLIFVPSNVTDSVTAYRIDDGAEQWRFYTDGPVRLAPAAWKGKVYFVSDDGCLYCVDAQSGTLVWKFRGGPSDHRLLGNERIISIWPARGGPAVADGTVYAAAGIWPLHGVFIYALDAASGAVAWVNDTTSSDYVPLPHGGAFGYGSLAPQGYIAVTDDRLVVAGGRGAAGYLDRHTGQVIRLNPQEVPKGGGGYGVHAGGMGIQRNAMLAARVESLSERIDGEVFYKLAAYDRLFVTTTDGRLYCFGPEEVKPKSYADQPKSLRPSTDAWGPVARDLLEKLGESQGYALLLGAGSGDLLREFLVRSDLHLVVVEADAGRVRALRDELADAGMYGRRAAVIHAEPASFSVQPYLFSMVLSEDAAAAGIGAATAVLEPILNRLRPYGGLAWLGASSENLSALSRAARAAQVDQVAIRAQDGHLLATRGGPLRGAGQWTHQYHDAANTLMSRDQRVRLPLGLLWYGGPNHDNILPRHAGGPKPQVAGGRQVFLGVETIAARCVYTGRPLWERQFPGIGHPFTDLELEAQWRQGRSVYMTNIPGATYIGSPLVTLADSIYLRYEGRIHRLDPATGQTLARFALPGPSVRELYGDENAPDWGHVSVQGDTLITTNEPHILEDQKLGWLDSHSGTSSRRLVVLDRFEGKVLWERRARIGFRHQAIVSAEDTLFVIDGLSENTLKYLARRGQQPEESSVIYALDLKTGKMRWRTDSQVFGTFLLYSQEHDILIEGGSQDLRRPLQDEPRKITARRGSDGRILWETGRFLLPAVVRGEMLIPGRPGTALSIRTGQKIGRTPPDANENSAWGYRRAYGCNTLNASESLLLYRTGYAGFYDLEHDSGTGNFGGVRSGCTANMIAADGVLNVLDYTRSCMCSYAHQTSLALIHMPGDSHIELWTRYDGTAPNPQGHGINFGAPGRRVGASGVIWHDQPGTHRRHPSAIRDSEKGINWVAASARQTSEAITVDGLLETQYIVHLHFAELDEGVRAGQRVFDVRINGRQVLSGYDIVAKTGAPLRGTVEEFSVDVSGGKICIELCRSEDAEFLPLINGIELIAQRVASTP